MQEKGLADVEANFKGKIVHLEQQLQAIHSSKSDIYKYLQKHPKSHIVIN
jgi:hypothetical protein